MPSPVEDSISHLSDSTLKHSKLVDLSHLNPEELGFFQQSWSTLPLKRRREIVSTLSELAEDNAELDFGSIFRSCLTDEDAEIRRMAIEGLWEDEDASLINPLINLLEHDSSETVQAAAATALGKFALLVEFKKLRSCHTDKIYQALLAVLNDNGQPVEVRCRALEAAAPLSLPQVKKAIAEAYNSSNSRLGISAIYAMGRSCDPSWLPILLKELDNASAEVRYEAAGACGELEEEEAVPGLIELTRDPDIDVRLAAIQALGKIGGSEAEKCLRECRDNPDEAINRMAEQALEELKIVEDPLSFQISDSWE